MITNKYGTSFEVGDYVFLPLEFYNFGVFKIVKIDNANEDVYPCRLWLDEYEEENGERHIRGISVDNPFIKVGKTLGKYLHDKGYMLKREKS